jgi:hypothetical protein
MSELTFDGSGTDASYLSHVNMFMGALFNSAIFRGSGWPGEKLGSQSVLQSGTDWYRVNFEGGQTGNRLQIAARKAARKELDLRIQNILHYVGVMAEAADIDLLVNSGVVTIKSRKKARKTVKPVVTN